MAESPVEEQPLHETRIGPQYTQNGSLKASLHVEVEDTGIGMTPESQINLFQPFTQVALLCC